MDSPSEISDVFSLSDHLLAERLHFVKEIGFGNWGSVWLCKPKSSSGKLKDIEVAVKLVHRSKTSTTAARVRSLWNEMKIVRSFKKDPHPSIVPFHSFIITPSYALITMAYLPTLVPVEVSELRAKEWFNSLLSGVHFLHSRGVVHNDIKPANILLSRTDVPVLVDFGFAEKYDLTSPKAFHSNLTYGTPEYLSPERARGITHDTRKADIWSLGVTFFEILVGRTPFEYEEGEVFEKKEDLEKYWHRTIRGKWVGKYSMSQSVERLLKRMIVPSADLRCTATELIADPYWDANPVAPVHGHRKSASAAASSSTHARTSLFPSSFKDTFKEKEKEPSLSRLLDISLPWSASKSTPRLSASRKASKTEFASRPASRLGVISRPASRTGFTPKVVSVASPTLQPRTRESPPETSSPLNRAVAEQIPPSSVSPVERIRTHSRSKSQPKLRSPVEPSTGPHTRKLSTVQASPIVRPERQISPETESEGEKIARVRKGPEDAIAFQPHISPNTNSSMKRPLGPRQPSMRIASIPSTVRKPSISPPHMRTTEKRLSPSLTPQTPRANLSNVRPSTHLPTPSRVSQTPMRTASCQTPFHSTQTTRQTSVSKQLSGRPPRVRGRAGVLADLTGAARNVNEGAHGVGHSARRGRDRKDRAKENSGSRTTVRKDNKENEGLPTQIPTPRKNSHAPSGLPGVSPLKSRTPVNERDMSALSTSLAANLSSATTVMKGSVRDRMMDWERERERLREMNKMTDTSADDHSTSDSSDDDDSAVEAEVVAEAASAQAKQEPLAPVDAPREVSTSADYERPTTTQTTNTISTSSSNMERSHIEIAKNGVRTSAQLLAPRNGSVTALGRSQSAGKKQSEGKNDPPTKNGLPVEVRRNSESGLTSLKHSVKASIDKGMRFYKSSMSQLTGRATPVWCTSPEPIDFEQRHSGEEGRFSWENIRHEHEIAEDRMNLWIQSVEKVVEETRQNFASTSVTPPAPLPLAPLSRSSSQYHSTLTSPIHSTQSNNNQNTLNTSRSSHLPRRLAANEIFVDSTNLETRLSPGLVREDASTSLSHVHVPESSVPVLPSVNRPAQTPRRRRATISTNSPAQTRHGSEAGGLLDGSPSKRREKSKSQNNLDRHIQDVAKLELELSKAPVSSPSPELSTVLDRSLFVAPPLSPRLAEDHTPTSGTTRGRSIQFNDSSPPPCHVEPYPARKTGDRAIIESPDGKGLEGVYDRFLMATSGVKRVGKGYQSDNPKPLQNAMNTTEQIKVSNTRGFGVFGASKRLMPPPVSSEDAWRRSTSVDELGFITAGQGATTISRACKDENKPTFVRRAIKAMVPGRAASRRLSRPIVV